MNKKIIIAIVVAAVGGLLYFKVLAKPAAPVEKHKIEGEVYVLPKDFLINLAGGKFAKVGVAIVFAPGFHSLPDAGGHGAAPPKPPEGFGVLAQEPVVRDIITDELMNKDADSLRTHEGREKVKEAILKELKAHTDVKAEEILFTDVTVQ